MSMGQQVMEAGEVGHRRSGRQVKRDTGKEEHR